MRNKVLTTAMAAIVLGAAFIGAAGADDATAGTNRELSFSREQLEVIKRHARGRAVKPVDAELEIGELLPDDMELHVFPKEVYRHVPVLRHYRYFIVEDEIIVVDPRNNRIVQIIED